MSNLAKRRSRQEENSDHEDNPDALLNFNEPGQRKVSRVLTIKGFDLIDGVVDLNVALTGATQGDLLEGIKGAGASQTSDTKGVLLEVVSGFVFASGVISAQINPAHLVWAYQKAYHISAALAQQQVDARKVSDESLDNAMPIGSGCPTAHGVHGVYGTCADEPTATFRILEPGVWVSIADEFGTKNQLIEYVLEGTVLTWRQILQLFGNKHLMLRASLFRVVRAPRAVPGLVTTAIDCRLDQSSPPVSYDLGDDLHIAVEQSAPGPLEKSKEVLWTLIQEVTDEISRDEFDQMYDLLSPLSDGYLRSLLQKLIRIGTHQVMTPHLFTCADLITVAAGLLILSPGGYVPNLHRLVRGDVSALKRCVVIIYEDAITGSPRDHLALLGAAVVAQKTHTYHPPRSLFVRCISLFRLAAASPRRVCWRDKEVINNPNTVRVNWNLQDYQVAELSHFPLLIKALGAFPFDVEMFERVVSRAQRHKRLVLAGCPDFLPQVPIEHCIDHHTQLGIGHVLSYRRYPTFKDRFKAIFERVTGLNSRVHDMEPFLRGEFARQVQFAQSVFWSFAVKERPRQLEQQGTTVFRQRLDPGVLAAGVGPIPCSVKIQGRRKIDVLVMLSTSLESPEEIVILRPSRAKVEDYFNWGNKKSAAEQQAVEEEKNQARLQVREGEHPVSSPLLPKGSVASFADGQWVLNGVPWFKWLEAGEKITVPLHPTPDWAHKDIRDLLVDNDAIRSVLETTGSGICHEAYEILDLWCEALSQDTLLRCCSLLRQQYTTVQMPVTSRDGGLNANQLQAYPGDWDVWRFLVLVSGLVPGALRPQTPPTFKIPNAHLLCIVLGWMTETIRRAQPSRRTNPWTSKPQWVEAEATLRGILHEHQKDAVKRLRVRSDRGARGHYLVMDTGNGKTYTAAAYALRRLCHSELGPRVRRIIWITPTGSRLSAGENLRGTEPLHTLTMALRNQFSGSTAPIQLPVRIVGVRDQEPFPEFTICIVDQDKIRLLKDALIKACRSSFVVFDEGDNFYGPSLRTSMALRVAHLCPEFIIQTATPIPSSNKISRMAEWLSLTEEFPVTKDNFLVAACNMVSLSISLGIESMYFVHDIDRTPAAHAAIKAYIRDHNWRKLYATLQRETDGEFLARAVYYAKQDRRLTPSGGCFVVCENEGHVSRLLTRCQAEHPDVVCGRASSLSDPGVAIVLVPMADNRGYNAGVRLGAQIRQPYPSSPASRHQMEGRIRRLNQLRPTVIYETVFMKNTPVQLLYERQLNSDNTNLSLEQIATLYESQIPNEEHLDLEISDDDVMFDHQSIVDEDEDVIYLDDDNDDDFSGAPF